MTPPIIIAIVIIIQLKIFRTPMVSMAMGQVQGAPEA